jgi:hypothetical protein
VIKATVRQMQSEDKRLRDWRQSKVWPLNQERENR